MVLLCFCVRNHNLITAYTGYRIGGDVSRFQLRNSFFQGGKNIGYQYLTRAKVPDRTVQLSCINAVYTGDAEFLHNLRQGGGASEIGGFIVIFTDNKCTKSRRIPFIVIIRHAVVANQRIGHNDSLVGIGRIGQYLLIPDHRGIEDDFAHLFIMCAKAVPVILLSVLQNNFSVKFFYHLYTSFCLSDNRCSNRSFRVSVGILVG